jgi:hypothetical protein
VQSPNWRPFFLQSDSGDDDAASDADDYVIGKAALLDCGYGRLVVDMRAGRYMGAARRSWCSEIFAWQLFEEPCGLSHRYDFEIGSFSGVATPARLACATSNSVQFYKGYIATVLRLYFTVDLFPSFRGFLRPCLPMQYSRLSIRSARIG